jgi:gliding motility-associated-like protein
VEIGALNKWIWTITLFLTLVGTVSATHNRAGEIIYTQIGDLTIRATIITYTKTSSVDADRDSLTLVWGDGTSESVVRSNGNGDELDNDIKRNLYIAEHTYPGRGTYTIGFTDPNRVANILNVNAPNSIEIPFYVQTTFTFLNSQFQGSNSSVQLLSEPIDFGCVGERFVHNPNAFDVDGDSISYELAIPQEAVGVPVPKYKFPDEIVVGPFNQIRLDPVTGSFVWDSPQVVGEYNIAIKINEYRGGVLIGSVIRDMQIFVSDCDNEPPTIDAIDEICVIAGEEVEIPIIVNDPDAGQQVLISATGGPFELEISPAVIDLSEDYVDAPATVTLKWVTECEHISDNYYQVVIKAIDNFFAIQNSGLAALKTIRIKVVGPPPENLEAETFPEQIKLTWDSPYACEEAEDNFFQGFSVWRKLKSNQFTIDTCTPGLDGQGYEKIRFITNEKEGDQYVYYDDDVMKGNTYCYRVLAEFAKISSQGFPFNPVSSLPSNEACGILIRDIPLITKVSVVETFAVNGQIDVKWIKPKIPDLDTLLFPGPYTYRLFRGEGLNPTNFVQVDGAEFTSPFFDRQIDTSFSDTGLNTVSTPYTYRVDFFTGPAQELYGSSSNASSVFLGITSNDRLVDLLWLETVPWENYNYAIYSVDQISGDLTLITEQERSSYRIEGLQNGEEYCFVVESEGTYGITDIEDPLFNFSQIACDVPKDSLAPCVPILNVINLCDDETIIGSQGEFVNRLLWSEPTDGCLTDNDLESFNIYFSEDSSSFTFLENVSASNPFLYDDFLDNRIAGCYAITSIDSSGNESALSNIVCSANCPLYELPNVFTPNGDNANDLYVPRENRFVASVDMKIFNRWGQLVFETTDPEINWDGTNFAGDELAEGVYYYKCNVQESILGRNLGQSIGLLSGSITIIRSR